jgi:hypothetical protein
MSIAKKIKELIGPDKFAALKQIFEKQAFITVVADDGTSLQVPSLTKGAAISIVTEAGTSPAESGTYSYTDENGGKWTITVDNGVITDLVEVTEGNEPADPPAAPATPPAADPNDPTAMAKAMKDAMEKFDLIPAGDVTAQISALMTMMKAVMEYCFGWDLQQADRQAAIAEAISVYQTTMSRVEKIEKATESLTSASESFSKAKYEARITELESATKAMGELIQMIGELPSDGSAGQSDTGEGGNTITFKRNAKTQALIDNVMKDVKKPGYTLKVGAPTN